MTTLNFSAAKMRAQPNGEILEFVFSGVLSRATMEVAFAQWQCVTHGHDESGYITRIDAALWISGDDEDFAGLVLGTGPWMTRPVAVVVNDANVEWFKRLALAQAARGVVLGVFTRADEALAWVRRCARVLCPRPEPLRIQLSAKSARKRPAVDLRLS